MDALLNFFMVFTHPQLLLLVGLGTFAGVYIGAIPGLSVTMAVSILISFTFSWAVLSCCCKPYPTYRCPCCLAFFSTWVWHP